MIFDSAAITALLGVLIGAAIKLVGDFAGRSQTASIAVMQTYGERVLRDRLDNGIEICRQWAASCLRILSQSEFAVYSTETSQTCIEAAAQLDAVYGRAWMEEAKRIDSKMVGLSNGSLTPQEGNAEIERVCGWISELEWYTNRQLRFPAAGFWRLRMWGVIARRLFKKR